MAKGDETFDEMCARLRQEKVPENRAINVIAQRRYFLIVSEGAKTEKLYFQYFKDKLPRNMVDTIEIVPAGMETIRVVDLAISKRDERHKSDKPKYDEVWAVFDKDDFTDESFNGAIAKAEQNAIEHGASNEAFELWYLLHYRYLDTALGREQYFKILSDILGFKYEKNSAAVVEHLFQVGKYRRAIEGAKKLEVMHRGKTAADSCPFTRVYLLVERLSEYLGMQ